MAPQGINVGPALLQRDVDATCEPVKHISRPYFDDIFNGTKRLAGESYEEYLRRHAKDLRRVFTQLVKDRCVTD